MAILPSVSPAGCAVCSPRSPCCVPADHADGFSTQEAVSPALCNLRSSLHRTVSLQVALRKLCRHTQSCRG